MSKTKLLEKMLGTLISSMDEGCSQAYKCESYEKQIELYKQLFEDGSDFPDREKMLVCGRCIISMSRSISEKKYCPESLRVAKSELCRLKPVFSQNTRRIDRQTVLKTVKRRVDRLTVSKSDEISDSVLCLYISLMQLC